VESSETRVNARRPKEQHLGIMRRRAALASALGFAAFVGLAAQHAVGFTKHAATAVARPSATASTTYFDEQPGELAFSDASAAAVASAPPPVAQTNVS